MVHAEGIRSTSVVQVKPSHPTSASHVGSIHPASEVHAEGTHSTAAKNVDPSHSSSVVHVDGAHPTSTIHVGPSLSASVSHAGGSLSASMVHAGDNRQPLRVMLTLLKRLTVQNTSPSFLVSFVRETALLINSLLSWRCEEFGFMVISFLNILKFFNNQPLLVRLDPVTQPLVVMLGENSHPL